MKAPGADEQAFLAEVAHMYYKSRMNQREIATRLGISRSMISRLLDRAERRGVVEILVHYPDSRDYGLEHRLKSHFAAAEIRVASSQEGSEDGFAAGCKLAAQYLLSLLKPDTVMAVAWGRAVAGVMRSLRPAAKYPGVKVVQPFGSALPNQAVDGTAIIGGLAAKLGGGAVYLHIPLYIGNEQTRTMLLNDPQIKKVIALAAGADFIVTGIGAAGEAVSDESSWNNYLSRSRREALRARGSAGHIFTRHFDIDGNLLAVEEYDGIMGLSHEAYMKIPLRIGVAMGAEKAGGIVGALRGGYINSLVTDGATAGGVLRLLAG